MFRNRWVVLCVLSIFFGGAAENMISQWSSSYIESVLGVSKLYGDIFGVAGFAFMLGLGRVMYARFGRRIYPVVVCGFVGAVACYLAAALTPYPLLGLIACGFTGFCTAMLWPGSLLCWLKECRQPMWPRMPLWRRAVILVVRSARNWLELLPILSCRAAPCRDLFNRPVSRRISWV